MLTIYVSPGVKINHLSVFRCIITDLSVFRCIITDLSAFRYIITDLFLLIFDNSLCVCL